MSLKGLLKLCGLGACVGISATTYLTFLVAYANNGVVTITINTCNEALIELIAIPIIIVLGIFGIIDIIKGEN